MASPEEDFANRIRKLLAEVDAGTDNDVKANEGIRLLRKALAREDARLARKRDALLKETGVASA